MEIAATGGFFDKSEAVTSIKTLSLDEGKALNDVVGH